MARMLSVCGECSAKGKEKKGRYFTLRLKRLTTRATKVQPTKDPTKTKDVNKKDR